MMVNLGGRYNSFLFLLVDSVVIAPAALVETVRVCQPCKVELDLQQQHAPPKTHSMAAAATAHEPANKS